MNLPDDLVPRLYAWNVKHTDSGEEYDYLCLLCETYFQKENEVQDHIKTQHQVKIALRQAKRILGI